MNQAQQAQKLSAEEIAELLSVSARLVRKKLDGLPESGVEIVGKGVARRVWDAPSLPEELRSKVYAELASRNQTIEQYRRNRAEPWASPLPFSAVGRTWQDKAIALQKALLPSLERLNDDSVSDAEFAAQGLENYAKQFGFRVTEDHWRRLLNRTVQRDRDAKRWQRLELFLDDAAFRKRAAVKPIAKRFSHVNLDDTLALIENRAEPTLADRTLIFDAAFRHYERLSAEQPSHQVKESIVAYLFESLPGLAKTMPALRRSFNRKFVRWSEGGKTPDALDDNRVGTGRPKNPNAASVGERVGGVARQMEGNIAGAFRLSLAKGIVKPEEIEGWTVDMARAKSRVPKAVFEVAATVCDRTIDLEKGERWARLNGPHIHRNHDDCRVGQVSEADDVTWPIVFKHADPETGKMTIRYGECLLWMDRRSQYIYQHRMIAAKYNSLHIKGDLYRENATIGLAEEYFLENGVWRARIIEQGVSWAKAQFGLHNLGIRIGPRIRHTKPGNSRAKMIERPFNVLQNRLALEPGFAGRNAHLDHYERNKELIRRANAGHADALAHFYTFAEFERMIGKVIEEYNHDPQNGRLLDGATPWQMWSEGLAKTPRAKLSPEKLFFLASNVSAVTPQNEGLPVKINGHTLTFCGDQIAELPRRKKVLAWWHIEYPNMITVTDVRGRNPFVAFLPEIPSRTATPEQFARAQSYLNSHMDANRTLFNRTKPKIVSTITRDDPATAEQRSMGAEIVAQLEEAQAEKQRESRERSKLAKHARARGIDPETIRDATSYREGVSLEEEALREIREMEKEQKP